MLKECIEVFEHQLKEKKGMLVLDTYVPADGTYLIVGQDGNIKEKIDIKKDKKTKEIDKSSNYFNDICFYDYQSQLISMNKPMDTKKVIHSNNYLSFAVKKDSIVSGKLTEEIIDGYYEILKNPLEKKYQKSKEASRIYQMFEQKEGKIDEERAEQAKEWIKAHIFQLEDVDLDRKDYLKIYFEAEYSEYEREGKRYFLPNIYNSNDYNTEIEHQVYGMPDNNLGMNAKKPFLSIKSRKYPAPYLLNSEEVILQKQFFDYLMNLVSQGKYHIYIDTDKNRIIGCATGEAPEKVESGYYLRISKGKTEAEIHDQDNIAGYRQHLKRAFFFRNILDRHTRKSVEYEKKYQLYHNRLAIGRLIDEAFFSNWLGSNYTSDIEKVNIKDGQLRQNILESRDVIFNWVFKGIDRGIEETIQRASLAAIKSTLLKDYVERALWQFNLRWSFQEYFTGKGEKDMAEIISALQEKVEQKVNSETMIPVESDEEYYYCVGQLARYLISLSEAKDKNHALLNPIFNAKTDAVLKQKLFQIYRRYNYKISNSYKRVDNLLAMVMGYEPANRVNQEKVMLGYACDCAVYKSDKEKDNK